MLQKILEIIDHGRHEEDVSNYATRVINLHTSTEKLRSEGSQHQEQGKPHPTNWGRSSYFDE